MRILVALLVLGFIGGARAAAPDYDLYVLVCDRAHCHRAPNVTLGADAQRSEYRAPGIALHVDTLAVGPDTAAVRLSVDIVPRLFAAALPGAAGDGGGRVRVQVEPRSLRPVHYAPITTFSSGERIYQIWARLAGPAALAASCANC